DGRTPLQQIAECYAAVREIERAQRALLPELVAELARHGILLRRYADLSDARRRELRDHYLKNIFPLVTPQAMVPAHPFPFVSNLSLNLLVTLHHPKDTEPLMARVKVPVGQGIPRLGRVGTANEFVPLEEVMAHNLDLLFPGMEVDSWALFRVTRNANAER